ncbi:MAG: NAD(P)H-dependent oxidoreductase [Verrucomicrobiota bacterium]
MKILAIAATNHADSINKRLLSFASSILREDKPGLEIEILDLIDYELPLYRQDRESDSGVPLKAQEFYNKIGQVDSVIISFAEHNGGFTAVYKNLFDWMSRIDQNVYQDKPMIVMAATPGPRGGAGVLGSVDMIAPHFGMNVKAKVSVPVFQENFNFETGQITNEGIREEVYNALQMLK